jgi:hypothetical protein
MYPSKLIYCVLKQIVFDCKSKTSLATCNEWHVTSKDVATKFGQVA